MAGPGRPPTGPARREGARGEPMGTSRRKAKRADRDLVRLYRRETETDGAGAWWIDYREGGRRVRRSLGTTSRADAEILAAQVRERLRLRAAGIGPADDDEGAIRSLPLWRHVRAFLLALRARGNAPAYLADVRALLGKCLRAMHPRPFRPGRLPLLDVGRVVPYLVGLERQGASVRTVNRRKAVLHAFGRWLAENHRAAHNPFGTLTLGRPETDRRRIRRALTEAEFAALLDAARHRPTVEAEAAAAAEALPAARRRAARAGPPRPSPTPSAHGSGPRARPAPCSTRSPRGRASGGASSRAWRGPTSSSTPTARGARSASRPRPRRPGPSSRSRCGLTSSRRSWPSGPGGRGSRRRPRCSARPRRSRPSIGTSSRPGSFRPTPRGASWTSTRCARRLRRGSRRPGCRSSRRSGSCGTRRRSSRRTSTPVRRSPTSAGPSRWPARRATVCLQRATKCAIRGLSGPLLARPTPRRAKRARNRHPSKIAREGRFPCIR